jgi:hypothetical protein
VLREGEMMRNVECESERSERANPFRFTDELRTRVGGHSDKVHRLWRSHESVAPVLRLPEHRDLYAVSLCT